MFLDLGALAWLESNASGDFNSMRELCTSSRGPPVTPTLFRQALLSLSFTNGADRDFVLVKYANTFQEILAAAPRLDFSGMQWGEADWVVFGEALPWYLSCETLNLVDCSGLTTLPESIGKTDMKTDLPHSL